MLIMINTFMSQSSAFGGEILAANSILMQIQYVMGDIFTGFSQAAAFLQTGLYFVWRAKITGLFTGLPQILAAVNRYDMFIVFFPVLSALGIVYYGVFNGTLQTTPICISMLFTAASYLLAKAALVPELGNSGLWLAFLVFYIARSGFLLIFVPSLLKKFPYRT